jgi:UDP-hydrolysing UDP-N-acetyl-D-glucosamine 2-epimerase
MNKRKVCVVVNSRANYGRIKSVLRAVQDHPDLELKLIAGASALLWRFGNVAEQIKSDGFHVDAVVYSIVEGENPTTMAKSTGMGIMELATQFENIKPDVAITVADRFETMATAIAASYMNIPLAHTQGGEVTGSIDESVRHAITKLAHIHFPATERARENVIRMGEDPEKVFLTGCPAIDIVAELDMTPPDDLLLRYGGVGPDLDIHKPYLVVLQHPVTTEFGSGMTQINETLAAVKAIGMQTVWLWPNVDAGSDEISKGLRMFRENEKPDWVHFYRNFSVEHYAQLIGNSACLIGNSSSGIREGSFLGVPAVNIGTRQANREQAGNCINAGYNREEIEAAVRRHIDNGQYPSDTLYGDGNAGQRIADILADVDFNIQKKLMYS